MTREDQFTYLGQDKIAAMRKLRKISPFFLHFSGSLSLFEYGVVQRNIGDLDIVAPNLDAWIHVLQQEGIPYLTYWGYYEVKQTNEIPRRRLRRGSRLPDTTSSWVNRVAFEIKGVKCCVFYGEGQEYKLCEYVGGIKARISHPRYAIAAKKKYVEEYKASPGDPAKLHRIMKHEKDIELFYKHLGKTVANEPI